MYYDIKKSGKRISELRLTKGLSQVKLADVLGIHEKTISKAERGVNGLSIDYLILLADTFCVSIEYLIGEDEEDADMVKRLFDRCPEERRELLLNVMKTFVGEGA